MNTGLSISSIGVSAGGQSILDGVGFRAESGGLTGLIGPNGAGKSTLMRAVVGVTPVEAGTVQFNDTDLLAMPRRTRAQLSAFVEQVPTDKGTLSRVRLGPVANRADADKKKSQAAAQNGVDGLVRPHP